MSNRVLLQTQIGKLNLVLVRGDITREEVDAIVNAANTQLAHGGGVAAAIVRAGGEQIQQESNELAPVAVGESVITSGGELPAKHVIHTVGPRWGEGEEEAKLHSAVHSALALARERGLESVSLPAISTGIFGFPLERAVPILLATMREIAEKDPGSLREIRLCLFDDKTTEAFQEGWGQHIES